MSSSQNVNIVQVNDTRTFAVPGANEFTKTTPFTIIVISILIVWIIIDLLTRFVFNLSYNTFGMDSTSSIHSFLILLGILIIFIATVWVIDQYNLVEGGLAPSVVGLGAPLVDVNTGSGTAGGAAAAGGKSGVSDARNGAFISGDR